MCQISLHACLFGTLAGLRYVFQKSVSQIQDFNIQIKAGDWSEREESKSNSGSVESCYIFNVPNKQEIDLRGKRQTTQTSTKTRPTH